jgi:hypothetical protein
MQKTFLSANEIMEHYPELNQKFNWTLKDLRFFQSKRLLKGYYKSNQRITMIEESSLLELIAFTNQRIQEQIIIIKSK